MAYSLNTAGNYCGTAADRGDDATVGVPLLTWQIGQANPGLVHFLAVLEQCYSATRPSTIPHSDGYEKDNNQKQN